MNAKTLYRAAAIALLAVGTLSLSACKDASIFPYDRNDNDVGGSGTVSLEEMYGEAWQLVGFERQTSDGVRLDRVPDDQQFTLHLKEGEASGIADCKGYGYKMEAEADPNTVGQGDIRFFDPAPQIALYCGDDSRDDQFYGAMQSADLYAVTKSTLRIYYSNGTREKALLFMRKDLVSSANPIVLYQLEVVNLRASDPYTVMGYRIEEDELHITVQYSGGCEEHDFTLIGPMTIPGGDPTPITIYLQHDANGDMCEALITEELTYDLTPLKERWKEITGRQSGVIELDLQTMQPNQRDTYTILYRIDGGSSRTDWLRDTIAAIQSRPATSPPESIWRYKYDGDTVYYRPPICCDIFSDLYDEDGNIICHPDGGIAGTGDGRCPDFLNNRSEEHLVWQDPR